MEVTKEPIQNKEYNMSEYYLTLLATFLVIVIVYLFTRRRGKSTNVVLLTGLSGAGKTAIFSKIIFNKQKKSFSSLRENEADNKDLNLKLIDLPGADRLRDLFWEQFRSKAKHVIIVLDSTDIDSKIRDLSDHLYKILSDSIVHKNNIKCTIACNKQDLPGAKSKDEIKSCLENEINALRVTKKGQLGKTSNEEDDDLIAKRFSPDEDLTLDLLQVDLIHTSMHKLDNLMKLLI